MGRWWSWGWGEWALGTHTGHFSPVTLAAAGCIKVLIDLRNTCLCQDVVMLSGICPYKCSRTLTLTLCLGIWRKSSRFSVLVGLSHSHCRTVALSHYRTVALSHCHTVALSHCRTVALSHWWVETVGIHDD